MDTPENMPYFLTGNSVTVEAGRNGFVVYTEDGLAIAKDAQEMLGAVLSETTNHAKVVAMAQAQQAQQAAAQETAEDAEILESD